MRVKTLLKLTLIGYGLFNASKAYASAKPLPIQIYNKSNDMNYNKGYSNIWAIPPDGIKYAGYFDDAERKHNLPEGILSRIAYQESHFRDDIITGKTKSSAGAIGLMQIIPRWHPNVDPYNPIASIYYAAGYLKSLYTRFGSWSEALAAYNWGPTNLANKGMYNLPMETEKYVLDITKDIGIG